MEELRELCEKHKEKQKIYTQLKCYEEEHNDPIDWLDDSAAKWFIYYNRLIKHLGCDRIYTMDYGIPVFSSYEKAMEAIEFIGEERLKKYYFEVEE